ncbi:unnamed protein product [Arctogadus glacialis]
MFCCLSTIMFFPLYIASRSTTERRLQKHNYLMEKRNCLYCIIFLEVKSAMSWRAATSRRRLSATRTGSAYTSSPIATTVTVVSVRTTK